MSLNSIRFIMCFVLLCIVLSVIQFTALLYEKIRKIENKNDVCRILQISSILVFSYIFICIADIRFGVCIALMTVFVYWGGIMIERQNDKLKRNILIVEIIFLLLVLGYFKYCNFFVGSFCGLLGVGSVHLNIILPLGISFYTLAAIGYLIDIYRKEYCAETNIINFALFMAFFSKITAGPIIRAGELLPQIGRYKGIRRRNISIGIQIFVFGLFKKIVLADRLGVFVDDVFHAPSAYNTFTVVLAVLSYSLQIYLDFSGYSDMAIGAAKILGFDFSRNFNLPYIAKNLSEFWKRWHISLSSWFKDYLYIPLGGSRKGKYRTVLNLIIVMLCSGLWHGAAWSFVAWGLFYGIFEGIYSLTKRNKSKTGCQIKALLSMVLNYVLVSLLWVIFRADSFSNGIEVYKSLFSYHEGIMQPYTWSFFAVVCVAGATAAAIVRSKKRKEKIINGYYTVLDLTKLTSLIIFFTFTGLTIMLAYFGNNAFIYGHF